MFQPYPEHVGAAFHGPTPQWKLLFVWRSRPRRFGLSGLLNDLWKFVPDQYDGSSLGQLWGILTLTWDWTNLSGYASANVAGVYSGTRFQAAAGAQPTATDKRHPMDVRRTGIRLQREYWLAERPLEVQRRRMDIHTSPIQLQPWPEQRCLRHSWRNRHRKLSWGPPDRSLVGRQ